MAESVAIRQIAFETRDVMRFVTDKPADLAYSPGQATEVRIDRPGLEDEARPFTFTSLPAEPHLEFMIKTYPERDGVTDALLDLTLDDKLILDEAFGAITYQGPGVIIAGGAGITPFVAIFRELYAKGEIKGNTLYFANEKEADIIALSELERMLGADAIFLVTDEKTNNFIERTVDPDFVRDVHRKHKAERYYLCGPPEMVDMIKETLAELGVDAQAIVSDR